jgi:hypothetical protein
MIGTDVLRKCEECTRTPSRALHDVQYCADHNGLYFDNSYKLPGTSTLVSKINNCWFTPGCVRKIYGSQYQPKVSLFQEERDMSTTLKGMKSTITCNQCWCRSTESSFRATNHTESKCTKSTIGDETVDKYYEYQEVLPAVQVLYGARRL